MSAPEPITSEKKLAELRDYATDTADDGTVLIRGDILLALIDCAEALKSIWRGPAIYDPECSCTDCDNWRHCEAALDKLEAL